MAKKRKVNSQEKKKNFESAKTGDSEDDGGDKMYDNLDYLELTEDQQILSKIGGGGRNKKTHGLREDLEELYAISGSSEDELPTIKKKKKVTRQKNDKENEDSDFDYGKGVNFNE